MNDTGRFFLLLLPLALAIAIACSDDSPNTPGDGTGVPTTPLVQLGVSVDLKIGETLGAENSEWSVTLAGVASDSRCPRDVTCVWAGEVTVSLVSRQRDKDSVELDLTLGPIGVPSAAFNEFRVTLQAVSPAPIAGQTIPLEEYVATIVVNRETEPAATTGIRGDVTLGPQCPVVQEGVPCPDKPYEATLFVFDGGGNQVAAVKSGPDGNYALALAPGSYRIAPQTPLDRPFPRAEEIDVILEAGMWTVVDVGYDSGIR